MENFYKERISRFNRNNSRSNNNSTTPKFTPSRDKVNKLMEDKGKSKLNENKANEKIRNLRLSINKSRSRTHSPDVVDKNNNRKDTNMKTIPKKSEMGTNNSTSNLNTNITKVDESAKLLINKLKEEKDRYRQNNKKSDSKGKYNRL